MSTHLCVARATSAMDEQEKAALGDGGNEHSLAVAEAEKARPLAFWIVTWGCIVLALPLAAALRSWEVLALAALHLAALTVDEFVTKCVAMQRYPRQTAAVVAAAYALACWRWWQSPDAVSLPVHLYKQPHFGAASGFRLGELNAASLVLPWPWLLALAVGLPNNVGVKGGVLSKLLRLAATIRSGFPDMPAIIGGPANKSNPATIWRVDRLKSPHVLRSQTIWLRGVSVEGIKPSQDTGHYRVVVR